MTTMNRNRRASMAKETVEICNAGFYVAPSGTRVEVGDTLNRARTETVLYAPSNPPAVLDPAQRRQTRFEARNETTFAALARLAELKSHVACLNFASAKNPGGGFLNGSLAQEEALACASGLYPCLLKAPEYYERNRTNRSTLYLDMVIFSPWVPFFRDDSGALLEKPILASVITAPAPNAGAIARNEPSNLHQIEPTLKRRAELVLRIAAAHRVDRLILGAWGCGVFQNDPQVVAKIFRDLLTSPGLCANLFAEVAFAVYDRSDNTATYKAFADQFKG